MAFRVSSSIFNGIRAGLVADGLSAEQLGRIVGYIDRSAIFERRIREFEQAGGQIEFDTDEKNFFWVNEGVPTVYVSTGYKDGDDVLPDIDELAKVIAHEMSHYETYFKMGFNPNDAKDADGAGAAGSRDEARAYALEYLVECEINATAPPVAWTDADQMRLAQAAIEALPAGQRTESAMLHAAAVGLLDWAANWTGPVIDAGGYFQFYKNDWLRIQSPVGGPARVSEVRMRCNAAGVICELDYIEHSGAKRSLVLDQTTSTFVSRSA